MKFPTGDEIGTFEARATVFLSLLPIIIGAVGLLILAAQYVWRRLITIPLATVIVLLATIVVLVFVVAVLATGHHP